MNANTAVLYVNKKWRDHKGTVDTIIITDETRAEGARNPFYFCAKRKNKNIY